MRRRSSTLASSGGARRDRPATSAPAVGSSAATSATVQHIDVPEKQELDHSQSLGKQRGGKHDKNRAGCNSRPRDRGMSGDLTTPSSGTRLIPHGGLPVITDGTASQHQQKMNKPKLKSDRREVASMQSMSLPKPITALCASERQSPLLLDTLSASAPAMPPSYLRHNAGRPNPRDKQQQQQQQAPPPPQNSGLLEATESYKYQHQQPRPLSSSAVSMGTRSGSLWKALRQGKKVSETGDRAWSPQQKKGRAATANVTSVKSKNHCDGDNNIDSTHPLHRSQRTLSAHRTCSTSGKVAGGAGGDAATVGNPRSSECFPDTGAARAANNSSPFQYFTEYMDEEEDSGSDLCNPKTLSSCHSPREHRAAVLPSVASREGNTHRATSDAPVQRSIGPSPRQPVEEVGERPDPGVAKYMEWREGEGERTVRATRHEVPEQGSLQELPASSLQQHTPKKPGTARSQREVSDSRIIDSFADELPLLNHLPGGAPGKQWASISKQREPFIMRGCFASPPTRADDDGGAVVHGGESHPSHTSKPSPPTSLHSLQAIPPTTVSPTSTKGSPRQQSGTQAQPSPTSSSAKSTSSPVVLPAMAFSANPTRARASASVALPVIPMHPALSTVASSSRSLLRAEGVAATTPKQRSDSYSRRAQQCAASPIPAEPATALGWDRASSFSPRMHSISNHSVSALSGPGEDYSENLAATTNGVFTGSPPGLFHGFSSPLLASSLGNIAQRANTTATVSVASSSMGAFMVCHQNSNTVVVGKNGAPLAVKLPSPPQDTAISVDGSIFLLSGAPTSGSRSYCSSFFVKVPPPEMQLASSRTDVSRDRSRRRGDDDDGNEYGDAGGIGGAVDHRTAIAFMTFGSGAADDGTDIDDGNGGSRYEQRRRAHHDRRRRRGEDGGTHLSPTWIQDGTEHSYGSSCSASGEFRQRLQDGSGDAVAAAERALSRVEGKVSNSARGHSGKEEYKRYVNTHFYAVDEVTGRRRKRYRHCKRAHHRCYGAQPAAVERDQGGAGDDDHYDADEMEEEEEEVTTDNGDEDDDDDVNAQWGGGNGGLHRIQQHLWTYTTPVEETSLGSLLYYDDVDSDALDDVDRRLRKLLDDNTGKQSRRKHMRSLQWRQSDPKGFAQAQKLYITQEDVPRDNTGGIVEDLHTLFPIFQPPMEHRRRAEYQLAHYFVKLEPHRRDHHHHTPDDDDAGKNSISSNAEGNQDYGDLEHSTLTSYNGSSLHGSSDKLRGEWSSFGGSLMDSPWARSGVPRAEGLVSSDVATEEQEKLEVEGGGEETERNEIYSWCSCSFCKGKRGVELRDNVYESSLIDTASDVLCNCDCAHCINYRSTTGETAPAVSAAVDPRHRHSQKQPPQASMSLSLTEQPSATTNASARPAPRHHSDVQNKERNNAAKLPATTTTATASGKRYGRRSGASERKNELLCVSVGGRYVYIDPNSATGTTKVLAHAALFAKANAAAAAATAAAPETRRGAKSSRVQHHRNGQVVHAPRHGLGAGPLSQSVQGPSGAASSPSPPPPERLAVVTSRTSGGTAIASSNTSVGLQLICTDSGTNDSDTANSRINTQEDASFSSSSSSSPLSSTTHSKLFEQTRKSVSDPPIPTVDPPTVCPAGHTHGVTDRVAAAAHLVSRSAGGGGTAVTVVAGHTVQTVARSAGPPRDTHRAPSRRAARAEVTSLSTAQAVAAGVTSSRSSSASQSAVEDQLMSESSPTMFAPFGRALTTGSPAFSILSQSLSSGGLSLRPRSFSPLYPDSPLDTNTATINAAEAQSRQQLLQNTNSYSGRAFDTSTDSSWPGDGGKRPHRRQHSDHAVMASPTNNAGHSMFTLASFSYRGAPTDAATPVNSGDI